MEGFDCAVGETVTNYLAEKPYVAVVSSANPLRGNPAAHTQKRGNSCRKATLASEARGGI